MTVRNRMLMDVLEYGRASRFADTFDIEWNHPYESLKEKLLAPFLGAFYGQCLENGDIQLRYDEAGFSINYYALRLPVQIASYGNHLECRLGALRRRLGGRHPDVLKLLGVLYTLRSLPHEEDPRERADQSAFVKNYLWELYCSSAAIKEFIDSEVASFNGTPHEPASFDALDRLLSEQPYRLSFWKVAAEGTELPAFLQHQRVDLGTCRRCLGDDADARFNFFNGAPAALHRIARRSHRWTLRPGGLPGAFAPRVTRQLLSWSRKSSRSMKICRIGRWRGPRVTSF
jgi:hypothetical protein